MRLLLKVASLGAPASSGGTLGSRAVKLIPTMKLILRPPSLPSPPRPRHPQTPHFQIFICSSAEGSGGVQPRHERPPPTQPPVRPQPCSGNGSDARKGFDVFVSFFFFFVFVFVQGQAARASASRAARTFFLSSFADDQPRSVTLARLGSGHQLLFLFSSPRGSAYSLSE